ncbi:MAG TPA: hypothetical protein VI036_13860 [Propionibacteriaceae bacterium]
MAKLSGLCRRRGRRDHRNRHDRIFASDGASNQQFFTDEVEWTTVETGEKIRGPDAVRDFIVALHMDPAHRLHRV